MSVKGGDHKPHPLPKGVATTYAQLAKEGKAHKVLEGKGDKKLIADEQGRLKESKERWDLYIFEKMGGMKEIGITALEPAVGYMMK